jgi:DNA-binding NtrC family response regulator
MYAPDMSTKKWLVSWIGNADQRAASAESNGDVGPIAAALLGSERYDRVHLLTDRSHEKGVFFCEWLESRSGYSTKDVWLSEISLISPINYSSIYTEVSKELQTAGLPREDVELTFHLSPGTPAMTAIWIILAKTRFPARLIQTSPGAIGSEAVNFPFDLADDFLPEFLRRSSDRIDRLANADRQTPAAFAKILHGSAEMAKQVRRAEAVAAFDVPVLILGESGTGKELFAQAIHAASPRSTKKFVPVNCGAISKELANSELFGHKKGAFTGALADRKGYFLEAQGGTLFLDEIGDLPLDSQVRLLRVLQEKEVTPVGASLPTEVDVRIIAATHRNLADDVSAGRFREDLYHRLAVGVLRLPPLRDRGDDLAGLVDHFLEKINKDSFNLPETQHKTLSINAKNLLISHPWPGNIRELYHTMLRASIWSQGAEITESEIREEILPTSSKDAEFTKPEIGQGIDLKDVLDEIAKDLIRQAWTKSGARKGVAAELLGFKSHQKLAYWMKRLEFEVEQPSD